jgi:hypothetical protein
MDVVLHRLAYDQLLLILDSKVISSKLGIVNLQNNGDIVQRICKDLSPKLFNLEVMPSDFDLGPPLSTYSRILPSTLNYQFPDS